MLGGKEKRRGAKETRWTVAVSHEAMQGVRLCSLAAAAAVLVRRGERVLPQQQQEAGTGEAGTCDCVLRPQLTMMMLTSCMEIYTTEQWVVGRSKRVQECDQVVKLVLKGGFVFDKDVS